MQAYRELLTIGRQSQLMQALHQLTDQQGEFVVLLKKGQDAVEAVLSKEPGYLFGESIWEYFGKPDNLIYCELDPSDGQIYLVVVQKGVVYLDKKIQPPELRNELLPLFSEPKKYEIRIHGKVPLKQHEFEPGFLLPNRLVNTFERLKESPIQALPHYSHLELRPFTMAVKQGNIEKNKPWSIGVGVLLVVALFIWWLWPAPPQSVSPTTPQVAQDPFAGYRHALMTVAPDRQLHEIVNVIDQLYLVPGWQPHALHFSKHHYRVLLSPAGGELGNLSEWASKYHYQFAMTAAGPQLAFTSYLPARMEPTQLYRNQNVLTVLVDEIDQLLSHHAVALSDTKQYGQVEKTSISIELKEVSPALLDLVGTQLKGLPVTLSAVDLNFQQDLINGTIQLSVWGS